jgi:hypothetical protein
MSAGLTHPAIALLGIPLSGKPERGKRMFRTRLVSNPSLCGNFVRHFLKVISLKVWKVREMLFGGVWGFSSV